MSAIFNEYLQRNQCQHGSDKDIHGCTGKLAKASMSKHGYPSKPVKARGLLDMEIHYSTGTRADIRMDEALTIWLGI